MRIYPSETPEPGPGQHSGYVPRPSDIPYLIVGIVLGAFVFIIVAFIPFCLWRTWAKQSKCCLQFLRPLRQYFVPTCVLILFFPLLILEQTSDLCFPAVAAPVSSCQYTMVPLQGLALVGHCPLDGHITAPHAVYPANGECTTNGKPHHPSHCLPGLPRVKKKKTKNSFSTCFTCKLSAL